MPGIRRVLVLSQYLDSRYATRLLEDHPEARGYLVKECVSDIGVLKDAIQRIAEGECVLDPTIVTRLIKRRRHQGPLDELTEREHGVLALVYQLAYQTTARSTRSPGPQPPSPCCGSTAGSSIWARWGQ
jgi:DNA-binding NarL/FixJ family response regulator